MARLLRPVTRMISSRPEATASSTTYWMVGLSTRGSISLGCALVAGRKRVPSPAAADALQGLEGASHVGIVGDADIHDGARPAPIVVGELRQIPVGHDALGSVEKAQPGDAKPDRLDHARVPAHLDHIPYPDQALEEDEKARDDVLDEALGAEAHSQPEHTGRDGKGADIHAHFLEHHDAHHEGQRVEREILAEGG